MAVSSEIVRLHYGTSVLTIASRSAFVHEHASCLESEEAVRSELLRAFGDPAARDALRRFWSPWQLDAHRLPARTDRNVLDRLALMTVHGPMAAYLESSDPDIAPAFRTGDVETPAQEEQALPQWLSYNEIKIRVEATHSRQLDVQLHGSLRNELTGRWTDSYLSDWPDAEIVEVPEKTFSYLFDIKHGHAIAAYGLMRGKNPDARDAARMANYPKAQGKEYHRGHLIPHSGHGGTDINLFIQLGSVNIGPFRELERKAVAHPGSFYFVRLIYQRGSQSQMPIGMEQGLLVNGEKPRLEVRTFKN
jgi:hypothetical protein